MPASPPFPPREPIAAVLPSRPDVLGPRDRALLTDLPRWLQALGTPLRDWLGAPVQLTTFDPGRGPRWLIGPSACNPAILAAGRSPAPLPVHHLDRTRQLLVTDAPDGPGLLEALSALTSLAGRADGSLPVRPTSDRTAAVALVEEEIANGWPAAAIRGIDVREVAARHRARALAADDPAPALQTWLAELGDPNTALRPSGSWGRLPYEAWVQGGEAVLVEVPRDSAAWRAGARAGSRLLDVDADEAWKRTAATPAARPLVAGRSLLAGPVGTERELVARSPGGARIVWREPIPAADASPCARWERRPGGAGYLRIHGWLPGLDERVDEAFEALSGCPVLVVDLRGTRWGLQGLALRFRDRFLRQEERLGQIRFRHPGGALAEPEVLTGRPARTEKRWNGPVRFLTDPLTHGASEDVLLGLQGLPHVQVLGEPSGGGSGWYRERPLVPGWRLSITLALTYDRSWRCVYGAGIPVDRLIHRRRPAPDDADPVLAAAEAGI